MRATWLDPRGVSGLSTGMGLLGIVALMTAVVAGATIWLLLTEPVRLATAVGEGDVSPLARVLAEVLAEAWRTLTSYL